MEKLTKIWFDDNGFEGRPTVTFQAGVNFTRLMREVEAAGYACENLLSLPHINCIGGITTASHGSGIKYPCVTKNVVEMDFVLADGSMKTIRKGVTPDFERYLINFGALGIVVSATMVIEKHYMVAKGIYLNMPFETLYKNFNEIENSADFLSFFLTWKDPNLHSVWVGQKYAPEAKPPAIPDTFFGAKHITAEKHHPCPGQDPYACIAPGHGSWTTKLCHFLPDRVPSSGGNEIQVEYYVPYRNFLKAFQALYAIRDKFQHLVQITEIRTMAKDGLPMSQAKNEPVIGIHFTCFKDPAEIKKVFPAIEACLRPFEFKYHPGKAFVGNGSDFERAYGDDLFELRKLIRKMDPKGRFSNSFVDEKIFNRSKKLAKM